MRTIKGWAALGLFLVACGGDDLTTEGSVGGAGGTAGGAGGSSGGSAGASAAGAAGTGGSAGTSAAGAAGASGQGGAAPVCLNNGEPKCEGDRLLTCVNGQFVLFADCKTQNEGKTPICSKDGCLACVAGDIGGCNPAGDGLLVCNSSGKLVSDDTKKCTGSTPYCVAENEAKDAHCVECLTDEQCPEVKNECAVSHCVNHVCKPEFLPAGTVTKTQSPEGCSTLTCDGQGNTSAQNAAQDTPCQGKTGYCDGKGICGDCLSNSKECVDGGSLHLCQNNKWGDALTCSDSSPACKDGGECVGVIDMAVGNKHVCAVLADATVRCWGDNSYGQLGLPVNDTSDHSRPRPVAGITDAAEVVVGDDFSCVRSTGGQVSCWGHNHVGQLGNGSSAPVSSTPQPVSGGSTYSTLVAGPNRVCAIANEKLQCWGHASGIDGADNNVPTIIKSGTGFSPPVVGVTTVAVGTEHTCLAGALSGSSFVYCFGDNKYGQLGNGTTTPKTGLVSPTGLGKVTRLVAGPYTTVAYQTVTGKTSLLSWGRNDAQPASQSPNPTPITVNPDWNINNIYVQGDYLGGWVAGGVVNLAGINDAGQLGKGSLGSATSLDSSTPPVPGADSISLWTKTVCAWKTGGTARCWGNNDQGQVGAGSVVPTIQIPTKVKW